MGFSAVYVQLAWWVISEGRQIVQTFDLQTFASSHEPTGEWELWWFCDFGACSLGPILRVPAPFAGAVKYFQLTIQEDNLNLLEDGAVASSTENLDVVSSTAEDVG